MDHEEMLKRILELTEENNRKIRSLYRGYVWGSIWRLLYWAIIIGIGIGAFYYLQPYINTLNRAYNAISGPNSTSTPVFDIDALKRAFRP